MKIPLPQIILVTALLATKLSAQPLLAKSSPELQRAVAQLRGTAASEFPPVPAEQIVSYTARRIREPIQVDGKLDERVWKEAKRSQSFVDLVTGDRAIYDTRVGVLWDDRYLYVGYWVSEPNVQAKFLKRDQPIWQDNDVELFVGFDHAYYELEINAHGTLYEGLFVWQKSYDEHRFQEVEAIDRRRKDVKWQAFNGVGYKNHPRGKRWAFLAWDFPGLKSAVAIQGTLNQSDDQDHGWTVELALPWRGMKTLARGDQRSIPPRDGDHWRMDFSRFNQYHAPLPARDSGGWALSHHGVWDSHIPEVFSRVIFRH